MDQMDSKLFTSLGANFTFRKPPSVKEYHKLLRMVFNIEVP